MINRGIMVEGKIELTVDGKTRICEKDDEYVIPAKARHYARFLSKSRLIDFSPERISVSRPPLFSLYFGSRPSIVA